jgi:hypothetical protein
VAPIADKNQRHNRTTERHHKTGGVTVRYDFNQPIDLNNLPASLVLAAEQDPAKSLPGAPPLFGRDVVPHFYTTTGYIGSAARAYPVEDEATRNSVENSIRMRTECAIMECLESRQRATALLKWHLAPENDKSEKQQVLCRELTRIIDRIPRFVEYRRVLLEALWYGKYAVANKFGMAKVGGHYRTIISDWTPRDGDKLMFRYDDGTTKFKEGQLGIRVHANFGANMLPKLSNVGHDMRRRIEPTQYGLVYWFNDYERETMVVHKHMVEDGPWREPRMMGRILGVGIRDRIYWTWYAMQALLQDLLTYSNRAALGVRLWRYPSGNPEWKEKVEAAAKDAISNGVADILFPVEPNDYASLYGVEQIEPGTAGAQLLAELIERFFLKKIKKYILGQLLTSEAEATGLGSGVAQAHLATFSDIVQYDAANLQETLTHELVRKIQKENAPKSMGVFLRFVLDTDTPDTEKRLQAIQAAYQMDVPIKVEDIYMLTGLSKPEAQDEIISVSLQQQKQQRQQNQMMMEQQAMMAASQGIEGVPGAEEGAPPPEQPGEPAPGEPVPEGPPEQATMDVSPDQVKGTEGPVVPASGELEEKASLDQPAPGAPWNGFFESLFNALDGRRPEAPPEDQEPERYDDQDEVVDAMQEMIDHYARHQRSVEDLKSDLTDALESQSRMSEEMAAGFDRAALTQQIENSFDFETLVGAIDRTFDAVHLRDELTALLSQRMAADHRNHSARDELLKALNKQFGHAEIERYAHAWAPYRGPRQGKGWKNVSTGEVRYQEKSPDREAKPETDLVHRRWAKNGNGKRSVNLKKMEHEAPYVGFDLDGTLAKFDKWQGPGHIGPPVPKMVKKAKEFLGRGIQVRIITARLGLPGKEADIAHRAIKKWCEKHIGRKLKVQAHKTPGLVKLYDDKAERVEKNTGETDRYTCTAADIDEAIRSWHPPTEGQAEAGNYRKPRIRSHGMEIAIENPKGTRRKPEWPELCAHYGYISRIGNQSASDAKDGDKVDVFLCDSHPESEIVFVIDQEKPDGRFDEHKVVMGAISEDQAANVYLDNYPDNWHCGPITGMAVPQFKAWLECGDLTKRVAHQVSKYMAAYEANPEYYARKKAFNPLQKTFDFDAPKPTPAAAPSAGQSIAGSPWVKMKGDRNATYWYNRVTNPSNDPGGRVYQEEMPSEGDGGETAKPATPAAAPQSRSQQVAQSVTKLLDRDDHRGAFEVMKSLTKSELQETWYELFGTGFYNQSKKEMLEEIAKHLPKLTGTERKNRDERHSREAVNYKARKAIENAIANKSGLLGAPINAELSDDAFRDPHDPRHQQEVQDAWKTVVAEAMKGIDSSTPEGKQLHEQAAQILGGKEQPSEPEQKQPWQMTRSEFIDNALANSKYRKRYESDPKAMKAFQKSKQDEWTKAVEQAGQDNALPNEVIDDYVDTHGETQLHRTFRGAREKGISEWTPKDARESQPQEQSDAQSREEATGSQSEGPTRSPEAAEQAGQGELEKAAEQPEGREGGVEPPTVEVPDIDDDVVHNWDAPYIQKQWAGKLTDEQKRDMNDAMRQHHQKGVDADELVRKLKAKWGGQSEQKTTSDDSVAKPQIKTRRVTRHANADAIKSLSSAARTNDLIKRPVWIHDQNQDRMIVSIGGSPEVNEAFRQGLSEAVGRDIQASGEGYELTRNEANSLGINAKWDGELLGNSLKSAPNFRYSEAVEVQRPHTETPRAEAPSQGERNEPPSRPKKRLQYYQVIIPGAFDSNSQSWHEDRVVGQVRAYSPQSAQRQARELAGSGRAKAVEVESKEPERHSQQFSDGQLAQLHDFASTMYVALMEGDE